MGTGIGDVIRRKAGRDVDLPADNESDRWQRFPCPFCGKPRAAINYAIGLFNCFHADCQVKIWASPPDGSDAPFRFRLQINQAVRNVCAGTLAPYLDRERHDIRQQAREMVIEYEESGQLEDWAYDVHDDPDRLESYVLRALYCDLVQWALKIARRRETPVGDAIERSEIRPAEETPHSVVMWVSWPTLEMKFRYGMTNEQIAKSLGVSVRTVKRRAASELADAKKTVVTESL
jgi:hypothetical protein